MKQPPLLSDPSKHQEDTQKILDALKAAGVVIPQDQAHAVGVVSSQLSKQGITVSPEGVGGLVATHYFIVWAN